MHRIPLALVLLAVLLLPGAAVMGGGGGKGGGHVIFRVDPAAGYAVDADLAPAYGNAELSVVNCAQGLGLSIRVGPDGAVEVNGARAGACDPGTCRVELSWGARAGFVGVRVDDRTGTRCCGLWPLAAPPDAVGLSAAAGTYFSAVRQ